MKTGVYKITSPSNKTYIGSSINIYKRWSKYKGMFCKSQIRLYNSFKKYGVENHTFEIITECEPKDLLKIESYWGNFYNVLNSETGLNCIIPKTNEEYKGVSEETKLKMSLSSKGQIAWNKGIPQTLEVKNKLSKKLKGRSVWNKGKSFSEASKKRMSNSSKGQIPYNRKIILDFLTGIFYSSLAEASNLLGYKRTTLQAMLNNQNPNKTSLEYV